MHEKLGACGVRRLVVEEAGEFGVFNDHGGIALDRVEVFLLEAVAGFGRDKHLSGQRNGRGGVLGGDRLLGAESFVDAHNKFGNVVEPGELRVVDDQAEEFTRVDGAVLALVVAALHVEKGLVELEERQAESDQFLACRRVVVPGRSIGVQIIHWLLTHLLCDSRWTNSKSTAWEKESTQTTQRTLRSDREKEKWTSRGSVFRRPGVQ